MSTVRLLAQTFTTPASGMAGVAARRTIVAPLLAATFVSLTFAAVLVPRADFDGPALEELEKKPESDQMSPHEREAALGQVRKVRTVGTYATALFEPALRALLAALLTWAAFRLAQARPPFLDIPLGLEQSLGGLKTVDETRAAGGQVEGGRIVRAEPVLHDAGGRGMAEIVGSGRSDDDIVDLGRG